jgi:hypothetical protein
MESGRRLLIASIEAEIGLLLREQHRLNVTVASKLTAPSIRMEAQIQLQAVQQKIRALSDKS